MGIRKNGSRSTEPYGSVKTDNALDAISLGQSQIHSGEISFFLKVSKIRDVIYFAGGLFGGGIFYLAKKLYSAF